MKNYASVAARLTQTMLTLLAFVCWIPFAEADVIVSSNESQGIGFLIGFNDDIVVVENEIISGLTVRVNVQHESVGDLKASLEHLETGTSIDLIADTNFSGDGNLGFDLLGNDNLAPRNYTFSDGGSETINFAARNLAPTAELDHTVDYLAESSFSTVFAGESTAGTWKLRFGNESFGMSSRGRVSGWRMNFSSVAVPEPNSILLLMLSSSFILVRRKRFPAISG